MSRESKPDDVTLSITVDAKTAGYLRGLTRSSAIYGGTLEDVLAHLVHSAADGMRRPGAWERGWLEQAFGDFPEGQQTPGVPYSHCEPWEPCRVDELDTDSRCARCGSLVSVHVSQWCTWECLGCLIGERGKGERPFEEYNAEHIPLEDLAVASLLAFVALAFAERDDRPRCTWCGAGIKGDEWAEREGFVYCTRAECVADREGNDAAEHGANPRTHMQEALVSLANKHNAYVSEVEAERLHELGEVTAAEGQAISGSRWIELEQDAQSAMRLDMQWHAREGRAVAQWPGFVELARSFAYREPPSPIRPVYLEILAVDALLTFLGRWR